MGIFLARILSPAEFGVIAIANMIVYYANNFTNFGLNNALVQKDSINSTHINTVFTLDLTISLVLAILTVLSADRLALFFNIPDVGPVLKWMSLYYVITTFYHIPVVILRREINFKFLTIVEFFEGLLTSIVAIFLALSGYSYWSIVIASLSLPVGATVLLMWKTRWLPKLVIGPKMGDLYSFGFWNFIRAQVQLIVSKIDYFFIGRYLDVHSLGLYEKSFELSERAMSGVTMPVNSIFFSTFSRLQNDVKQVKQVFLESVSLLTLISYPVLFGLIGVAPHFVRSCLGEQWEHAIVPLQILSSAGLFRVLLGMVANVNVALGKYKAHTLLNIISAIVFIVLCFTVVESGIIAISWAFLIYSILSFLFSFWLVYSNADVYPLEMFNALLLPFIGSSLMLCAVITLQKVFLHDQASLLELTCQIIVGAVIYLSWVYYFYQKGLIAFRIKERGEYR
jgi:O-antigen/teichoic acid export membrane protein